SIAPKAFPEIERRLNRTRYRSPAFIASFFNRSCYERDNGYKTYRAQRSCLFQAHCGSLIFSRKENRNENENVGRNYRRFQPSCSRCLAIRWPKFSQLSSTWSCQGYTLATHVWNAPYWDRDYASHDQFP